MEFLTFVLGWLVTMSFIVLAQELKDRRDYKKGCEALEKHRANRGSRKLRLVK